MQPVEQVGLVRAASTQRFESLVTRRGMCGYMCYGGAMDGSISVRDLRNTVSEVLRRVESGERLTVTVDRRPVAEIVPLRRQRTVPAVEALAIASRHAADRRLLREVRSLLPDTTDDVLGRSLTPRFSL